LVFPLINDEFEKGMQRMLRIWHSSDRIFQHKKLSFGDSFGNSFGNRVFKFTSIYEGLFRVPLCGFLMAQIWYKGKIGDGLILPET